MPPTPPLVGTPRECLEARLAAEFSDPDLAARIVAALSDDMIDRLWTMADGDLSGSPTLSYQPPTVPPEAVDSLWVFAYGYRFTPDAIRRGLHTRGAVPPPGALEPGPVNEALAAIVAHFVVEHPVPVIAQWEVAAVLSHLGVEAVISVEPDESADGTVTYLSTVGVAAKGLRLAAEAGVVVGHAGVLGFADHAARCVLTARAARMTAAVPHGVALPREYDPESGQPWTRSLEAWIPVDLLGRTAIR